VIAEPVDFLELTDFTELMEKQEHCCSPANPRYIVSIMPMIRNISIGQLGLAAWLRSLPTLVLLLIAEHGKLGKVLDFLATTKTVSVLSTFFWY